MEIKYTMFMDRENRYGEKWVCQKQSMGVQSPNQAIMIIFMTKNKNNFAICVNTKAQWSKRLESKGWENRPLTLGSPLQATDHQDGMVLKAQDNGSMRREWGSE